ncbi:MAG: hypothetical protein K2I92_09360 [Muribaculaceae bacterium]|nr:hypothetical protein [Muribaculaceae bacterium]
MKKLNYLTLAAMPLLGAFSAEAALISPSAAPGSYGKFIGKTIQAPAKVIAFPSTSPAASAKGQARVQAYANEGNGEVDRIGTLTLLEEEDFSLLATGSEEAPDFETGLEILQWVFDPETGDVLRDEYNNPIENPEYEYPWNNMKHEFISGDKGWGIGNAYPAGGMLYFPFSQETYQGKISTPWIDLSANGGTFVLEFKVKVTEEAMSNPNAPAMIIVETAETNGMSPTWDFYEETFVNYENLSTEWTTFRLVYQGAGTSTLCNIVGQGLSGGMFIDDVRLYSLKPYLATPEIMLHSDFTEESFVLNWKPVEGAEKYLVNIWYKDLYDRVQKVADNAETTTNSYKAEGTNLDDIYFYTIQAVNEDHASLTTLPQELFDIVPPKMRQARLIDADSRLYEGGVEEVLSAFGYNYSVSARRVAAGDGPFVITDEKFTGWSHPLYDEGWNYTKEEPVDDKISSLYFPTDINQQGWYGKLFMIYKDYICLCPFFYEASYHIDQSCWVSPEFDLSKDGGKITVSMNLAAQYDYTFENYASCAVALFNWNDEKGDYEQVELAICSDLGFDWSNRTVTFEKGGERSKIGFFAIGSYGDLYIDDILITQDYKAGEAFDDPFYFSTWQLAENVFDPTVFEFEVPERVLGNDIHQRAQAVRMHLNEQGGYDGEKESSYAPYDLVADASSLGVTFVDSDLCSNVKVSGGVISISNPEGKAVSVSSASGASVSLGSGSSLSYRPSVKGVYVVTVGRESVKIVL